MHTAGTKSRSGTWPYLRFESRHIVVKVNVPDHLSGEMRLRNILVTQLLERNAMAWIEHRSLESLILLKPLLPANRSHCHWSHRSHCDWADLRTLYLVALVEIH